MDESPMTEGMSGASSGIPSVVRNRGPETAGEEAWSSPVWLRRR